MTSSNEAVHAAVEAGLGVTAITATVAFRLPAREFHVLRHAERHCSRAGSAFLTALGLAPSKDTRSDAVHPKR